MPQVKSAGKAQAKASTKITIALPDELLEWADLLASVRRLERNDVIRTALSLGLIAMQAETLRLSDQAMQLGEQVVQDWGGLDGLQQKLRASLEAHVAEMARRGES